MNGQAGTIYMLHCDRPYRHARHYTGWTGGSESLNQRLARHAQGHGARLIAVISQAGIGFTLARTTTGARDTERAIKNAGGATRYCPVCTPRPRNGRWS
jgi:predicted GIY-YIG superfamily endonuclease